MEEIVITGLGLLTAAGLTPEENWKSIATGRSAIRGTNVVPVEGLVSGYAGELPGGLEWESTTRASLAGAVDRCHDMVVDAVAQAASAAKLSAASYIAERVGISLGTSLGGARSGEQFHRQ